MRRCCFAILLVLLVAFGASAQLDRATITGTVSDSTGALVPGASVVIEHMGTHARYETTTTQSGVYTQPNLPIGPYQVTVEAPGFKKFVRTNITLAVSDVGRVDVKLEVGAVTESIQVNEALPRIQTDSPEVGTNMTNKSLLELPLSFANTRNPEDFVYMLVPGATGDTWTGRVNGSLDFGHESLLDGASATSNRAGNFEGAPSIESLQEFKVKTSGISAEYGRVQTAVMNYVMKSGNNEIHGSAYGGLRNEAFNANSFANNFYGRPRGTDRKENWALSGGAPVYIPHLYNGKDKSFFYVAYEQFRQHTFTYGTPNVSVPIPEFYGGDFSRILGPAANCGTSKSPIACQDALGRPVFQNEIYDPLTFRQVTVNGTPTWVADQFAGNKIPAGRISKVSQNLNKIMQEHYMPTVKGADGQFLLYNNAFRPSGGIIHENKFSVKFDQNISDKQKLSGSFSQGVRPMEGISGDLWDSSDPWGGPLARTQANKQAHRFYRINHDYTISPTILNHFTAGVNRFGNGIWSANKDVNGAQILGLQGLSTTGYPRINWGGGPYYTLNNPGEQQNTFIAYTQYQVMDTVSFAKGRHFMKAGVDIRRNQDNYKLYPDVNLNFSSGAVGIPNASYGSQIGYSFASYLLGIVGNGSIGDPWPTGDRRHYYALFFQDDFKATSRLTLNLGLRWDYAPPGFEVANRLSSFSPNVKDPVSGLMGAYTFAGDCNVCTGKNYFGTKDYKDFGPRIGLAYRVSDNWTVRAAYGISYEGDFFGGTANTFLGKATNIQSGGNWDLSPSNTTPWLGLYNWDNAFPAAGRYTPGGNYNVSYANTYSGAGMIDPRYGITPYIQSYNFNIQRNLPRGFLLDMGYIGTKGSRLRNPGLAYLNQNNFSDLLRFVDFSNPANPKSNFGQAITSQADADRWGIKYPYPGFSGTIASALRQFPQVRGNNTITNFGSPVGSSFYNSLQVTINREFRNGLSIYGNYVWSKTLSNTKSAQQNSNAWAADVNNIDNEWSYNVYDVPHNVKFMFVYDLPVGRGKSLNVTNAILNNVVGGWTISGVANYSSGTPMAFPASTWPSSWNGGNNRANVLPGNLAAGFDGANFNMANLAAPQNKYINTSLIQDPTAFQLGTGAPYYGNIRNFGTKNENVSFQKNFSITEKKRLQFRAEFMNLFNRHQFNAIENRLWRPNFGQVTGVDGMSPRQVQMVARFDF